MNFDDYDPGKETLQQFVRRNLKEALEKELQKEADRIIYGEGTGGPLVGILDVSVPPPFALCCCGAPLVGTLEVPKKEWYCVKCERFYEWLHARSGDAPNPTQELQVEYDAAKRKYDNEHAIRRETERIYERASRPNQD